MRPPLPPFTEETAREKVCLAEDGWNSRDPQKVPLVYTINSVWRNRNSFVTGRQAVFAFLTEKWNKENGYRLIKELFAFRENRIAVRYAYEYQDDAGHWFRAYGNENWVFDADGLMAQWFASISDLAISEQDRLLHWPQGRRPDDHPRLAELGL